MGALFDRVASEPVLAEAWKRIRAKKSAGGLDGVTVAAFEKNIRNNLANLKHALLDKTYSPDPLQRIEIPKGPGTRETRPLSLPTVEDKIVQQAVRIVIEPIIEPTFLESSYAYRPGGGTARAYKKVNQYLAVERRQWAALADFDRFFDCLDQNLLFRRLESLVPDEDIIRLVRMWVKTGFVNRKGDYFDTDAGVGQGSVISPLLSNLYAHPLDEYMAAKAHAYVRYADNLIVLCRSRNDAKAALSDIALFSSQTLKLSLNNDPDPVRSLDQGFVFLGIFYREGQREISGGKMAKILGKVQAALRPGADPQTLMEKLNHSLKGIRRHYEVIRPESQFVQIDDWVVKYLAPVLADYVKKGLYRTVGEMTAYADPIAFLSETFGREKEKRIREMAGTAINLAMVKEKPAKIIAPPQSKFKKSIESADRAVLERKRRYVKDHAVSSEVAVVSYGAFLGKTANRLVVRVAGKVVLERRLEEVRAITVASAGVSVSSDIVRECCNRNISIVFLEPGGRPYALVLAPNYPKAGLGLLQQKAAQGEQGPEIARNIVMSKIKNQLNLMKFYGRSRPDDTGFQKALDEMKAGADLLANEAETLAVGDDRALFRDRLFSVEGRAAAAYWDMARRLLPEGLVYPGRKRQGADDLVNSLLNYGYGMLYGRVHGAVAAAGLNPETSFLHALEDRRPSLVFDLIEEFRSQAVDRAVFTMFTRGEDLSLDKTTGLIDEPTKKKLIANVLERLGSLTTYRGKKIRLEEIISLQAQRLRECLEKKKSYRPFVGRY